MVVRGDCHPSDQLQVTQGNVVELAQGNFAESRSVAAGAQGIRDVSFRRGKDGEGRVIVDLASPNTGIDIRQQGGNLLVDFLGASLPEHLHRRSDVTDFGTPITSMSAQQTGNKVRLTVTPNGVWEHNAYQTENRFVLEVKRVIEDPSKLGRGRDDFQGEKLSLNFQDVDVRSVLQVIADFTNLNIIASDSVQGQVTLRLKDVPWDQALGIILNAKQLGYRKSGSVIWVAPEVELRDRDKAELEASALRAELEPLQTENIQINYHKAKDVASLLESNTDKTRGFLSKRGKVSFDERSNTFRNGHLLGRGGATRDNCRALNRCSLSSRSRRARRFLEILGVRLGFGKIKAMAYE